MRVLHSLVHTARTHSFALDRSSFLVRIVSVLLVLDLVFTSSRTLARYRLHLARCPLGSPLVCVVLRVFFLSGFLSWIVFTASSRLFRMDRIAFCIADGSYLCLIVFGHGSRALLQFADLLYHVCLHRFTGCSWSTSHTHVHWIVCVTFWFSPPVFVHLTTAFHVTFTFTRFHVFTSLHVHSHFWISFFSFILSLSLSRFIFVFHSFSSRASSSLHSSFASLFCRASGLSHSSSRALCTLSAHAPAALLLCLGSALCAHSHSAPLLALTPSLCVCTYAHRFLCALRIAHFRSHRLCVWITRAFTGSDHILFAWITLLRFTRICRITFYVLRIARIKKKNWSC